jgi:hypothetical protein
MIKLSGRTSSYAWRFGMSVKADVAGMELEKLQEEHGKLTPAIVVNAARTEDNPLHPLFDWQDKTAAEAYRHQQAAYILRNLQINYIRKDSETDEPQMRRMRVYLNVKEKSVDGGDDDGDDLEDGDELPAPKRVYLSSVSVFQDPHYRSSMLGQAKRELETWRNRYAAFQEFDSVIREIDVVMKTLVTEVKAAA